MHLRDHPLRPHAALLTDLIDGPAFDTALAQLLITLEHSPDRIDDIILKAARRFIDEHRHELADMRTGAAADGKHVSELVLRAYAQADDRAARNAALDMVDELLLAGAYGVDDAIRNADRG